ncbi:DUF4177 domain-containing protein [Mycoplasma zalophi]|uniref:DUF4177 domain-containing protein n=1 Tax=Mycoplasma zalophi TaxID=191287 RepID=A0ABS6DPP7_9MOLU|nr:DUF4177 domain-containing protein [Mycoplasma zalophi]MBU4690968.1 DUF4177 domain-containing protein [Mycoplasma zalophi]MBU4692253.1 DUF4177 domain-containing protein [Mycoplasma zalophi]
MFREKSVSSIASEQKDSNYVVLQVILKEKWLEKGSKNLTDLEYIINQQTAKGYRLHTLNTTSSIHSAGLLGVNRMQAILVFEKIKN